MTKDKALDKPFAKGLRILSRLFQIGATVSGHPEVAAGGMTIEMAAEAVLKHRDRRRIDRTERLLDHLSRRLDVLEEDVADDAPTDLFMEFMASAIEDEDDQKNELYAAFMIWVVEKKPDTTRARILGDAIRNLSYIELVAFIGVVRGRPLLIPDEIGSQLFWNRVASWGLAEGATVTMNGNPTPLGRILAEIWPEGEV